MMTIHSLSFWNASRFASKSLPGLCSFLPRGTRSVFKHHHCLKYLHFVSSSCHVWVANDRGNGSFLPRLLGSKCTQVLAHDVRADHRRNFRQVRPVPCPSFRFSSSICLAVLSSTGTLFHSSDTADTSLSLVSRPFQWTLIVSSVVGLKTNNYILSVITINKRLLRYLQGGEQKCITVN